MITQQPNGECVDDEINDSQGNNFILLRHIKPQIVAMKLNISIYTTITLHFKSYN
jgi:hypothetical protein